VLRSSRLGHLVNGSATVQVLEAACKQVAAEVRLYRESIRSVEELRDTTGVELVQGRSSGKARPMVVIKQEKLDRAANYERVGGGRGTHDCWAVAAPAWAARRQPCLWEREQRGG
jgi:hypothetical protein